MSQNSRILQVVGLYIVCQASGALASDKCSSMDAFTSDSMMQLRSKNMDGLSVTKNEKAAEEDSDASPMDAFTSDSMMQLRHRNMAGLSVTSKEKAAEEDSDASPLCQSMRTGFNEGGSRRRQNGLTFFMDRHSVDCGATHVMKQWNLQRSGNTFRINYQCCEVPGGVEQIQGGKTTTNQGGDEQSLDGLIKLGAVNCGNNFLQKWQLRRTPLRIDYWCAKPKTAQIAQGDFKWGLAHDAGPYSGELMFLDRHNVECPVGQYLSQWNIERTADKRIQIWQNCLFATPPPTPAPTPAPTRAGQVFPDTSNEKAMVFVVDVSGSMSYVLGHLQGEFKKTVQNLEEWQYFSMVKFSTSETTWKDHLLTVNATHKQEATAWIDDLVAAGNTYYHEALQKAYNMPLPANVDLTAVFLVSDGAPSDCPDKESCYQAIFDSKPNVRVRTIALNGDSSAKDILRSISKRTGGDYADVQVKVS